MAQISRTLTGSSGKVYQLTEQIGSGGEGVVFRTDDPTLAIKLYKQPTDVIQRKIEYMISCPVNSRAPDKNATPIIAWPQDALFDSGKFVGYVMPLVADTLPMFQLSRGDQKTHEFFRDYSWLIHLAIAFNLSNTIRYLHSMGMIVGDMNSKNMVVHRNGLVTILDVDSFDLTNPDTGEHFPCVVGRPEFLPPELQGRDLRNATFTIHSDEFGLAVHIFRLLLHNRHPFDVKVSTEGLGSVNQSKQEYNISVGNCAYVRAVPGCEVPPNEPTLDMLTDALKQDFAASFSYTDEDAVEAAAHRTTAEQWYTDLKEMFANHAALMQRCDKNPEHYFLKERGLCEFCRVKVPAFKPRPLPAAAATPAAPGAAAPSAQNQPAAQTNFFASRQKWQWEIFALFETLGTLALFTDMEVFAVILILFGLFMLIYNEKP